MRNIYIEVTALSSSHGATYVPSPPGMRAWKGDFNKI